MLRSTFRRPSPALVVGLIALIAAMGGTAVAAKKITSKDIKNNTIKGKDIKRGGVKKSDLSKGAKSALTGATGATGQQGPQGERGPSNAFSFREADEQLVTFTKLGSVTVGVGDYSVVAKTVIRHAAGPDTTVSCVLAEFFGPPGDQLTEDFDRVAMELVEGEEQVYSFTGTTSVIASEAPMELGVRCESSEEVLIGATETSIVATQVGAVNAP